VVPRVPVMERQYELAPAMVVALVVMVRLVVVVKVVVGRRWTEVQKVGSECVEVLVAAAAVAPAPALAPAAAPAPAQVWVLPCHTLQRTSQRTAHMHRHYTQAPTFLTVPEP
jgi:hypothetical protein